MIVGERITERMKALRLSQSEVARRVGITQGAISQLIKGDSRGSTHIHKIARVLQTTPAYLAGETDDPQGESPESSALSAEEERVLAKWRRLSPDDQRALERVMTTMLGAPVLGPRLAYDAAGNG